METTIKPKVSLLLPVYNSFSFERSDGKRLLPLALDSLLSQTYKDFELIILDNQSTDDTASICKDYAAKDSRIRYTLDTKKRFAEEAITELGSMAQGFYSMIVNDDDLWEKHYIERAVSYMDTHPDIDLVYGRAFYINIHNFLIGQYVPSVKERYQSSLTHTERFTRYINLRNVIPINFGLFKTEAFRSVLPYEDFDTLKSNVDNVFMSKFFILGCKAEYIDNLWFFYRRKERRVNPRLFASNMPSLETPVALWLFYTHHQLLFFKKVMSLIKQHSFHSKETNLRDTVLQSCLLQSFRDLSSLVNELHIQKKIPQRKLLKELAVRFDQDLKHCLTIEGILKFIEYSYAQEETEEGKKFQDQIISILKEENNSSSIILNIQKESPLQSFKEKLKLHPYLKGILAQLQTLYFNIRYASTILSIRKQG